MRVICSAVLIAASTAIGMTDVYAQGIEYGKNDYGKFCADCHGATGKGDGKFAKSLKRAPGDLTKLSENNKGVFPTLRIYDVIDGRIEVMTHGKRDMPVWGNVFTDELIARLPPIPCRGNRLITWYVGESYRLLSIFPHCRGSRR